MEKYALVALTSFLRGSGPVSFLRAHSRRQSQRRTCRKFDAGRATKTAGAAVVVGPGVVRLNVNGVSVGCPLYNALTSSAICAVYGVRSSFSGSLASVSASATTAVASVLYIVFAEFG